MSARVGAWGLKFNNSRGLGAWLSDIRGVLLPDFGGLAEGEPMPPGHVPGHVSEEDTHHFKIRKET
ncbi:MAG: hypothetical protein CML68_23785 [Rhodobacteraceae bacterium]|nr:hypothetical protein [Paracoccaceae bacterium]